MKWIGTNKRWFILALAIIVCGSGSWYYLEFRGTNNGSVQDEIVVDIAKGDIRSSVTGTSQLEPLETQILSAPSDAVIKTMNLTRNMDVKQGDLLVELTSPTLESQMQKAQVLLQSLEKDMNDTLEQMDARQAAAPIAGKLTLASGLDVGTTINKNAKLATIADNSVLTVTLPFALEDSLVMKAGDPVDLSLDGFMATKIGKVAEIGKDPLPDLKGGKLVTITITVENDATMDAGIKVTGTVASGSRVLESKGSGSLQYIKTVNVLAGIAGTIDRLDVKNGDVVKQGDLIVSIVNDSIQNDYDSKKSNFDLQVLAVHDLQEKLDALALKAPYDGVFSTDFVNKRTNILTAMTVGTKVSGGTQFGGIASSDSMQLPIQVDELDLPNVKVGMKAEVKADSLAGRIFNAEVTQVSTVGTTTNGVTFYDVVLAVKNTNNLKYGMTATGEILFQDKKDVVLLPIEALQRSRGSSFVTLKKADGTLEEEHEIKIGIRSKTHIEVTEGLKEGDKVIIPTVTKQQTLSQQDINQLRQQFQNGGQGQGGAIQINPEDVQRFREQFQNGGGFAPGGAGAGAGGAGGARTGGGGGARNQ